MIAMLVAQVMTHRPRTCGPHDPLNRAAQIMWDNDCGCVPVVDPNERPIGMITDRDVCMAAFTQGRTLSEISVEIAYGHPAVTVREDDPVEAAEDLMRRHQLRRLPAVDASGRTVGLLSIHDLAHQSEATLGRAERLRDTLARICQPRAHRSLCDPASELVEEIMTSTVHTCTTADALVRPAQLMWEHDCGAIPVTRRGDCVAMVTDRDICMAAYIQGTRLADIGVAAAASHRVYAVRAKDSIEGAHAIMRMYRVRRLPVVDAGDNLVGILSLADIVRHRPLSASNDDALSSETLTRTLEQICHWHGEPAKPVSQSM